MGGHDRTAAVQKQNEKGAHCKLTTWRKLERANGALVLTAFGGVLEKSPGVSWGQRKHPPGTSRGRRALPPTAGLPGGSPDSTISTPCPPSCCRLLPGVRTRETPSTRSTKENAQVSPPPQAGN